MEKGIGSWHRGLGDWWQIVSVGVRVGVRSRVGLRRGSVREVGLREGSS